MAEIILNKNKYINKKKCIYINLKKVRAEAGDLMVFQGSHALSATLSLSLDSCFSCVDYVFLQPPAHDKKEAREAPDAGVPAAHPPRSRGTPAPVSTDLAEEL